MRSGKVLKTENKFKLSSSALPQVTFLTLFSNAPTTAYGLDANVLAVWREYKLLTPTIIMQKDMGGDSLLHTKKLLSFH